MMKVFIDGGEGTTGLRLAQRLKQRSDIELLTISSDLRKNLDARLEKIDLADVAFLCLPDAASREVAEAAKNCDTKIIDTSTAFRCDPDWAYGFPELGPQRRAADASGTGHPALLPFWPKANPDRAASWWWCTAAPVPPWIAPAPKRGAAWSCRRCR